jgi:hypothetical protein
MREEKMREIQSVIDLEAWEARTLRRHLKQDKVDDRQRLKQKMQSLRQKYHPKSQFY